MKKSVSNVLAVTGFSLMMMAASPARAVDVRVTVTNLGPADGIAFSPVVVAAHNGTVDLFDNGSAASTGVENVAEMGNGTDLMGEITTMQGSADTELAIANMGGFGPGIHVPGSSGALVLSLDPTDNRYFSFLSMVVPSNDAFVGNDDPLAHELFDAGGNFVGQDFTLMGSDIWDAGTEINGLTGACTWSARTARSARRRTASSIRPTSIRFSISILVNRRPPEPCSTRCRWRTRRSCRCRSPSCRNRGAWCWRALARWCSSACAFGGGRAHSVPLAVRPVAFHLLAVDESCRRLN